MPPIEAFYLLVALAMSIATAISGKRLKIGFFDISRAHFYGVATRELYIKLPEEDQDESDAEPMCGLLNRSMYGTQDASHIWQQNYSDHLVQHEYQFGNASKAIFYNEKEDTRGLVHGDDFMVLADEDGINKFEAMLQEKYVVKRTALLGPDPTDDKEAVMLNRVLVWRDPYGGDEAIEVEADSRHAELIVKQLGLENAKGVDTPSVKRTEEEERQCEAEAIMPAPSGTLYRSCTMRAAYLSTDRIDIGETVKNLARNMQNPKPTHLSDLKRLGRYLKRFPQAKRRFVRQKFPEIVNITVDADWAGCLKTRKSTSGVVSRFGNHLISGKSNLQSTIALSSGESEFYAISKGAALGLFLRVLLGDWGLTAKVQIATDSSAAKSFCSKRGLVRAQRHVQTRYLWVQERIAAGDITVIKVSTVDNVSDILTKSVSRILMQKQLQTLKLSFEGSKSKLQREVLDAG
jgi:hypothetical protein